MKIANSTNPAQLVDVKLCTGVSQGMRELKSENNIELDPAGKCNRSCGAGRTFACA